MDRFLGAHFDGHSTRTPFRMGTTYDNTMSRALFMESFSLDRGIVEQSRAVENALPSSKHFGQPKETHLPAGKHAQLRRRRGVLALPRGEEERRMCLGLFALQDNILSLLKDEPREEPRVISSLLCLDLLLGLFFHSDICRSKLFRICAAKSFLRMSLLTLGQS